jgi:hypothetical protein
MAFSCFENFIRLLPSIYVDQSRKENYVWWEFSGTVDEFNVIRHPKVICSNWSSADKTMSAWRPRTAALGGLPNIVYC